MNVLFLTLSTDIDMRDGQSIYGSIIHELNKNGDNILVAFPQERNNRNDIREKKIENVTYLAVKTGNIQKTNLIEKGISTILIEGQFERAIKRCAKNIKFDLILYSTPPITFSNVIRYFKKRDNARTYLMLKDIFPQNAIDLGYFSRKSVIYKYFRKKEISLYKISDKIGCMSPANKSYILEHNQFINENKVEIFPNSIIPNPKNRRNKKTNIQLRKKYNVPKNSIVFMYGGNLGKPQGVDFIIKCLENAKDIKNAFFLICGRGTEYRKLQNLKEKGEVKNILLINGLPKQEYTELLNIADVGLVFLDYRFTIPNYPSRLLSYCEKDIPILCCTDKNTDIGRIISDNKIGWWVPSNNPSLFCEKVKEITKKTDALKKCKSYNFLCKNYNTTKIIKTLIGQAD